MKHSIKRGLILALLIIALSAEIAFAFVYSGIITVSNNTSTSYSMFPSTINASVNYLVANSFISSTGNDTQVQSGAANISSMLAGDRILIADALAGNSNLQYNFVTGQTPKSSFQIITGYGGYITTNDTAALEPSNNFSITASGYISTTAAASQYIVRKDVAMSLFVSPTMSGNITAEIISGNETLWPDGAGDETNIINLLGAPTHWQAVSDNSTASFVYTNNASYERDLYTLGNMASTSTIYRVTIYWRYGTNNAAHPAYIKPAWKIGGTVYDGSEQTTTSNDTIQSQVYMTSPSTGIAWTSTEVNAAQVGASIHNDTLGSTQLYDEWVVVDITNQTSVTGISSGEHTVIVQESPASIDQSQYLTNDSTGLATTIALAQTFKPSISGYITKASANVSKSGLPTGNITASIRNTSGGSPLSTNLTISNNVSASTAPAFMDFTFSPPIYLSSNTTYAFVLVDPDDTIISGNYPIWLRWNGDVYTNGKLYTSADGGNTWIATGDDNCFKTYTGGVFSLNVDGTTSQTTLTTVIDNSSNWQWMLNSLNTFMPYANYFKLSVSGVEKIWYQPNTIIQGTALIDRDSTKNGDITWGANPVGITATMGALNPSSAAVITAPTTSQDIAPKIKVNPGEYAPSNAIPSNPFSFIINFLATGNTSGVTGNPNGAGGNMYGIPPLVAWLLLSFVSGIGTYTGVMFLTRLGWLAGVLAAGVFGIFVALHVVPLILVIVCIVFIIVGILQNDR